jgi:hypothetical protein
MVESISPTNAHSSPLFMTMTVRVTGKFGRPPESVSPNAACQHRRADPRAG